VSIHRNTLFFWDLQLGVTFQGLFIYFSYFIFDSLNIYDVIGYLLYSFTRNISLNFNDHRKILRGFFGRQLIEFFRFKIFKKCGNSPLDGSDSLAPFF
jgi:hypothetical protein